MQDPATVAWMIHANVSLPEEVPPGRYPSPAEIRKALDAIPGIRVTYLVSERAWSASMISRKDVSWASLAILDFNGDSDVPHPFCFEGGWDEMIHLVSSHLSKQCGALVLLHDSGTAPVVIT